MKAISLKLPETLHAKLEWAAKTSSASKSDIVRAALEEFLANGREPRVERTLSALELAGDLVGCVEGPGDLSTNPKYVEEFGK
jgi:predicted transcriptional regulator